ncbi:RNase H domain-containing protein [Trichonephila clavipes]|nr:RNase H domain-containing protein [Trichonephila clavipes]
MSALESLHFSTEHRHPTVIEILLLLRKLERKGFDVIFSWVPGHVGILGNEQADTAARSMSDYMQRPVYCQDLKTSAQNYVHRVWQETWDQQVLNKLHSIHPSTSHWAALLVRRHDVHLTRLRIVHTRFTHRHLLLGSPRVKVITDHAALTRLTNGKSLCRRISWVLKLAEFNIEWGHRLGTQNAATYILSRNLVESIVGEQVNCTIIRDLVLSSQEQLMEEQRKDPELGHTYRYLENPEVDGTICEN